MTLPQVTSQRLFSQNISKISRNNISALELKRPWTPSPLQHQSQLPDSAIKQVDNFIPAPTPIPDTKPALVLTSPPSEESIALTQRSTISPLQRLSASPQRSTASSSPQRSTASTSEQSDLDYAILNPPSACFIRNQGRNERSIRWKVRSPKLILL
ncbi:uncharacterized protein LOC105192068 [Harpegnathos saltator]|uniref:uncharacterized protein LOC105192068 n=1 Tax=Harpegnathos saltator TaxID=610380 RepID=UPI00058ACB10|nr:uncharacterized protein LOC105192068 [Harpegnathos saltator]